MTAHVVPGEAPVVDDEADLPRRGAVRLSTVVGLVIVAVGVLVGMAPLSDNSFLTHLATGRLILDQGVPTEDVYSFTAAGDQWVVQSWLFSAVLAQLEAWGGLALVRTFLGLSTGLLTGLVWLLTAPARGLLVRIVLTAVLVLMGIGGFWPERPLLFGLIGLALVLLSAEGRFDPRWVVPVMWVWANVHGSFPMAVVVVGLLWAGRHLDGGDPATERRLFLWTAVGTALATLGPLGPKVLLFPAQLLSRQDALGNIVEWRAPDFVSTAERLYLVLVVLAVLALLRRPSWRAGLPFVVFLVASLLAMRNAAPASLVFLPGTAAGIAGLRFAQVAGDRRTRVMTLAAGALMALIVVVAVSPLLAGEDQIDHEQELLGGPDLRLEGYPVAALSWMQQEGLLDGDTRLVAREFVGNLLSSATDGAVPVFVDDRFDMYPSEVLEDHAVLLNGTVGQRGGPLAVLERHDPGIVLWESATATGQLIAGSGAWGVVYEDDTWLVACPREPAGGAVRCGDSDR